MKIKNIKINGLYNKYDITFALHEDVNILSGINGSFKTTLLQIINNTLNTIEVKQSSDYQRVEFCFTNDYKLSLDKVGVGISTPCEVIDPSKLPETLQKKLHLSLISTNDIKFQTSGDKSVLDTQLEKLQSEYGYYLSELSKRMLDTVQAEGKIDQEKVKEIYRANDMFKSIIGTAFKETGKRLNAEKSKLEFIFDTDGSSIYADGLSAGEKQLLIILLTILMQDEKEHIVLMDEPEISLHISWQYELLNWIRQINPNVQIITTTHSPMIFGSGWGDKVVYMENILSDATAK
ncbi:AAA family ATPase [Prevotella ihumii]|uniref:AAA family ATPase n=1 Tax=Prevotella ihumii TaxID=1917878 RepID=UPI000982159D|nr:AAA family ATPase [Prevotella ihumii]